MHTLHGLSLNVMSGVGYDLDNGTQEILFRFKPQPIRHSKTIGDISW